MTMTRNDGLTLLEVLAAFLIFSLVFTVLVGSSQKGVQSQGIAARRLEANEKADAALTQLEIEAALNPGSPPVDDEQQIDEFTVRSSSQERGGLEGEILSLVDAQLPGFSKYLRRYDVEVEWFGRGRVQKISRTTFDYDIASARMDPAIIFGSSGRPDSGGAGADGTDGARAGDSKASGQTTGKGSSGNGATSRSRANGGGASKSEAEAILQKMREAGYTPP